MDVPLIGSDFGQPDNDAHQTDQDEVGSVLGLKSWLLELVRDSLVDLVYLCRYMGLFRMAMMHTKMIRMNWEMD